MAAGGCAAALGRLDCRRPKSLILGISNSSMHESHRDRRRVWERNRRRPASGHARSPRLPLGEPAKHDHRQSRVRFPQGDQRLQTAPSPAFPGRGAPRPAGVRPDAPGRSGHPPPCRPLPGPDRGSGLLVTSRRTRRRHHRRGERESVVHRVRSVIPNVPCAALVRQIASTSCADRPGTAPPAAEAPTPSGPVRPPLSACCRPPRRRAGMPGRRT